MKLDGVRSDNKTWFSWEIYFDGWLSRHPLSLLNLEGYKSEI